MVWLAAFAGAVAMVASAVSGRWTPGYVFGPFVLLFLLLTLRIVTARFHPSNWLVRVKDTGLYVQYRSYLNFHLAADHPSIVFLPYREIATARLVRERITTPDVARRNTSQTQRLRHVELELRGDTAAISAALHAEVSERAPMEKRLSGASSTLYRDYPVSMQAPPALRIRWDVVPRANVLFDILRPYAQIGEPIDVSENFAHLESVGPDEQHRRLRELAQRGQMLEAIEAARKIHGCGIAEAKAIVEQLLKT